MTNEMRRRVAALESGQIGLAMSEPIFIHFVGLGREKQDPVRAECGGITWHVDPGESVASFEARIRAELPPLCADQTAHVVRCW